jgi:hypothetical protein
VAQYLSWMSGAVRGDFGESYTQRRPVWDILRERFPRSMELAILMLADEGGFWYVTGRSDDTLKIAGKRVGPTEKDPGDLSSLDNPGGIKAIAEAT